MRLMLVALIVVLLGCSAVYAQDAAGDNLSLGVQNANNAGPAAQPPTAWWSGQTGGWIGSIGGTSIGLMGGLMGTLAGLGKARRFVLGLSLCMIVLGVVILIVGLAALTLGQPYAVYYPLLIAGFIMTAVFGGCFPAVRKNYEQRELQKMAAMDTDAANTRVGL